MQLHPYTTYNGGASTNRGEDRHGILGANTIDSSSKFKEKKRYETYLQTRGDLFHSLDEETEGTKLRRAAKAHKFNLIPERLRTYSRKRKAPEPNEAEEENVVGDEQRYQKTGRSEEKNTTSSSSDALVESENEEGEFIDDQDDSEPDLDSIMPRGGQEGSSSQSHFEAIPQDEHDQRDDAAFYGGHRFFPQTRGIRDGGECLWDTLKHYGVEEKALQNGARAAGLTFDHHVDARDIDKLLEALAVETGKPISMELVTFDLISLRRQSAVTIGTGGSPLYVALFNHDQHGHYVPES